MDLYVIRHAIAQPLGKKNEFSDEKRSLTAEGRVRTRDIAKGLKRLGIELDLLMTSPLVRAVETAEILALVLDINKKEIIETPNLSPGASTDELFAEIKGYDGAESIALVGHQPDLGVLVSKVVSGNDEVAITLKKGAVCYIKVGETVPTLHGDLEWLLTPRQLRLIA